jgi:hypothetical protein
MQTGTFEKLSGEVEADETFIGGKARNMHKSKRAEKITGRACPARWRLWACWSGMAKYALKSCRIRAVAPCK